MADISRNAADLPIVIIGATTAGIATTPVGSDSFGALLVTGRSSLIAAAPVNVSVSTTSVLIMAANLARRGMVVVNVSTARVSIGINNPAVLNAGITLYPGGVWTMDDYTFTTQSIAVIGSLAGSISVQEFT